MNPYDAAHALARAIQESPELLDLKAAKQKADADETNRALLTEYKRLQMQLQIAAMGGAPVTADDQQRFSQIASLLMLNLDVQAYLMAEMREQRLISDIFKIITDAAEMNLDMLQA